MSAWSVLVFPLHLASHQVLSHEEEAVKIIYSEDSKGTMLDLELVAECTALCHRPTVLAGDEWGPHCDRVLLALAAKLSARKYSALVTEPGKVFEFDSAMVVQHTLGIPECGQVAFMKGCLPTVLAECDSFRHHVCAICFVNSSYPVISPTNYDIRTQLAVATASNIFAMAKIQRIGHDHHAPF